MGDSLAEFEQLNWPQSVREKVRNAFLSSRIPAVRAEVSIVLCK
jgi:hypothetical protein